MFIIVIAPGIALEIILGSFYSIKM